MVPKFHLPAHVASCQTDYSLNFNEKVGRTDGEGIERGWGNINPIATSTREMGPGSRNDRLDQVLNDLNWVKVTRLGEFVYPCCRIPFDGPEARQPYSTATE